MKNNMIFLCPSSEYNDDEENVMVDADEDFEDFMKGSERVGRQLEMRSFDRQMENFERQTSEESEYGLDEDEDLAEF